jgi:hypothetical protein
VQSLATVCGMSHQERSSLVGVAFCDRPENGLVLG